MDGSAQKNNSTCPNDEILKTILNLQDEDELKLQIREHLRSCQRCQQRLDQLTSAPSLKSMHRDNVVGLEDAQRKLVSNIARRFSQKLDELGGQQIQQAQLAETQFGAEDTEVSVSDLEVRLPPEGLHEHLPKTIGRYSVLKELGRGGAGVVYLAFDPEINRKIAIKRIHSAKPGQKNRLIREAKAAAQLQIDQVVRIFSIESDDDGNPFITMEYVEGRTLLDEIKQNRNLTTERAVKICSEIAMAVQAAHDLGMLHRDIKPGNVLLDKNGHAKLADFGLAHLGESAPQLTKTGVLLGTPAYMSPEQAVGGELDGRSDIYSLGCVLYETLTGTAPFLGTTHQVLKQIAEDAPASIIKLNENVPKSIHWICGMAMAKRPENRYASAQDLRQDLNAAISGDAIVARPESTFGKAIRWYNKNTGIAWLSGLVAALLIATTIVSLVSANRIAGESLKAIQAYEESKRLAVEAAEQRELAVETLNELVIDIQNDLKGKPGTLKVKQSILETALQGLKKVVPQGQALAVSHANSTAYLRMADIELLRGNDKAAAEYFEQARVIAEKMCEQFPDQTTGKIDLGYAILGLADLKLSNYLYEEALAGFSEVRAIRQTIVDREPSVASQFDYARILARIGGTYTMLQQFDDSLEHYQQAVEIMEGFEEQIAKDIRLARSLAVAKAGLASQLIYSHQYERASTVLAETVDINEQMLSEDPYNTDYLLDAAVVHGQLSQINIQGFAWSEALKHSVAAREKFESLVDSEPGNDFSRSNLALWWGTSAQIQMALNDLDGAEKAWLNAYEVLGEVLERNPDVIRFLIPAVNFAGQLAGVEIRRGKLDEALQFALKVTEHLQQVPENMRSNPTYQAVCVYGSVLPDTIQLAMDYVSKDPAQIVVESDVHKCAIGLAAYVHALSGEFDQALIKADKIIGKSLELPELDQQANYSLAATYAKLSNLANTKQVSGETQMELISKAIECLDRYVVAPAMIPVVVAEPDFIELQKTTEFQEALDRWKTPN